VKDTPNKIRAKIIYIKQFIFVIQGTKIKYIAEKINKVLSNLNKCHASVNPTNKLLDKKNFSPFNGSPPSYLFLQEILGSQKS